MVEIIWAEKIAVYRPPTSKNPDVTVVAVVIEDYLKARGWKKLAARLRRRRARLRSPPPPVRGVLPEPLR
jgi:hypothetical protein